MTTEINLNLNDITSLKWELQIRQKSPYAEKSQQFDCEYICISNKGRILLSAKEWLDRHTDTARDYIGCCPTLQYWKICGETEPVTVDSIKTFCEKIIEEQRQEA